eukprot:CAMPEP_0202685982 /NCGR_PEP_ID=MMETSP1385-20130828/1766_1 /ASSEMBLY_ACC=CAM_ASM_000861 /TAXON_ID=933848 /ORGANISM="Elphidium margaritaceum" /LENGTH=592 /DNA_ID=CAMNT_0049340461 /DNA_START=33 /DNA_END=1811 /DNA_ORIENTATION=+
MAEQKTDTKGVWECKEFQELSKQSEAVRDLHLRDLLSSSNKNCQERNDALTIKTDGLLLDCTRQKATTDTLNGLLKLAEACNLKSKIDAMFNGDKINKTEKRSVLHIALRAKATDKIVVDNVNVVESVHAVLQKIEKFSAKVRSGEWKGFSGKAISNVISIGIGGSYLGAEFVFEALKTDPTARKNADGRQLRFYANIDPIGFARATANLDPETTLCIVVSKTFTTRETMMNAQCIREWLLSHYNGDEKCLTNHFIAASANPTLPVQTFGVDKDNIFEFWDWVGGRYSVSSAVGILPLSLHYGYEVMADFLRGANAMDEHFRSAPFASNIPVMLGLFGVWNTSLLGYKTRALIPYCEALSRLPAHIQQLDMESNGKRIDLNGNAALEHDCSGEIDFGEPGTNAQHSFFQLIHQGRVIPVDFVAFCQSQLMADDVFNAKLKLLIQNNHDELMSNFFAQCDALALGKTAEEVRKELEAKNMSKEEIDFLVPHKVFSGDRPSSLLLFDGALDAFKTGQILSLFEHRTVTQGFVWNVGSFDQWGVELGKMLGKTIRSQMDACKAEKNEKDKSQHLAQFNGSTQAILEHYCKKSVAQ